VLQDQVGRSVSVLLRKYVPRLNTSQLHLAVAPITSALLRLDSTGAMLTTSHVYLVKIALEAEAYAEVAPLLERPILYFPSSSQTKPKHPCDLNHSPATYICKQTNLTGHLKYYDVLEYFFYSGIVFMSLGRWEEALECLENAVTYPAKDGSVSKIMVEAYKKWILVGLLTHGTLRNLPSTTSGGASKSYHILGKPYESLAQIFESGSASRLKSEADYGTSIWLKDGNTGLVMHVLAAYQKWQIRNLAKVYSKISIQEVHNQTTSAETGSKLPSPHATETLVQAMIQQGELPATLDTAPDQQLSVLSFSPGGPVLSEAQVQRELAASTLRIQALTKEIKETDVKLTHDKEYINFLRKQKKHLKNGTAIDTFAPHEMDWHDPIEDEDIMSPY
jgi:COP9 signalosome complex subunit 3